MSHLFVILKPDLAALIAEYHDVAFDGEVLKNGLIGTFEEEGHE